MKILYDHQIFAIQKFGGISRYFNELMKVSEIGVEIETIDPELFINYARIPVLKQDLLSRGVRYLKRRIIYESNLETKKFPIEIKNKISNASFDLFHPTYYDPYFLEYTKKPFVLTVYDMIHEIYKEFFDLNDKTSHYKRLLCEKADQIIAISETTKKDLIEILNVPEEKVHAIPLASSFDSVLPRMPENVADLNKYILFTGNRNRYKNFYFSLYALADILKSDNDLQLLCTGPVFSADELLFFKDLGILEKVKHLYLKNDEELAWVYRNAALFIFPSLYEGFGFPLLEAFASDCPVISSPCGSLKEVGENAPLYFNPKDLKDIQSKAIEALYNNTVRSQMINNGRAQFQKFNWEKLRMQTLEVYKLAVS